MKGMAVAMEWTQLAVPAILIGTAGYATATFFGIGIGETLLKTMIMSTAKIV